MGIATLITLAIIFEAFLKAQGRSAFVAQDGTGDFSSIISAVQAGPNNSPERYLIYVKKGTYFENVVIGIEKRHVALIGEGMDKTIISGNRSNGTGFHLSETSTGGYGFQARDITFENTAGPKMYQAVALEIEANDSIFYRCRFRGYQDTLYTNKGSQFFRECEILGTIDFIFGNSIVVFQNCLILVRKPLIGQYLPITAQGRHFDTEHTGTIFQNCTINATEELRKWQSHFKSYFGRPWKDASRTVFMQSYIDSIIHRQGWIEWEGQPLMDPYYAEYKNWGPGAETSGRVKWSKTITTTAEASKFTVRNFFNRTNWIPSSIPHFLDLL